VNHAHLPKDGARQDNQVTKGRSSVYCVCRVCHLWRWRQHVLSWH